MITIVKATELRDSYATIARTVRGGKKMAIITKRGRPDLALIDLDYLEDLLESRDVEFLATLKTAAKDKTFTIPAATNYSGMLNMNNGYSDGGGGITPNTYPTLLLAQNFLKTSDVNEAKTILLSLKI